MHLRAILGENDENGPKSGSYRFNISGPNSDPELSQCMVIAHVPRTNITTRLACMGLGWIFGTFIPE